MGYVMLAICLAMLCVGFRVGRGLTLRVGLWFFLLFSLMVIGVCWLPPLQLWLAPPYAALYCLTYGAVLRCVTRVLAVLLAGLFTGRQPCNGQKAIQPKSPQELVREAEQHAASGQNVAAMGAYDAALRSLRNLGDEIALKREELGQKLPLR